MTAVSGPVIFDENTSRTLPSRMATVEAPAPSGFGGLDSSSTFLPSIVMVLGGSGTGASAPAKPSACWRRAVVSYGSIARAAPPMSRSE